MAKKTKSVPDALKHLADLYEKRNVLYGDDYKRHGERMMALFPNGVVLDTPDDFNRFAIVQMLSSKLGRYSYNFFEGGHVDSLDDLSVYAQMLQELDSEG